MRSKIHRFGSFERPFPSTIKVLGKAQIQLDGVQIQVGFAQIRQHCREVAPGVREMAGGHLARFWHWLLGDCPWPVAQADHAAFEQTRLKFGTEGCSNVHRRRVGLPEPATGGTPKAS
jgi:hypothetical protein